MGQRPAVLTPAPPWTRRGSVRVGPHAMHYATAGRGPPLVLLHKLGGWMAEWEASVTFMTDGRQVAGIDLPGHGDSTSSEPPPRVQTLEDTAAAVMAVLETLSLGAFDLAGASLGGAVAAVIAATWPGRVRRLVLLNAPLLPARAADDVEAQDVRTAPSLWDDADRPLPRPFKDSVQRFGLTNRAIHDDITRSRARAGPWVRPSWRGAALGEVAGRLAGVRAPTLALFGERRGPAAAVMAAVRAMPGTRCATIAQAGAFPHQDNPSATAAAIQQHLGS